MKPLKVLFSAERSANFSICDALRDLGPLVQFEERKRHPWRSVTFSKVAD